MNRTNNLKNQTMKREIKFRGISYKNNKMVYGMLFMDNYIVKDYYINQDDDFVIDDRDIFAVKEETIGQFTGLKDKKGKEIYEGDIVESENTIDEEMYGGDIKIITEQVIFSKGSFNPVSFLSAEDFEVIGNIYENPELLK